MKLLEGKKISEKILNDLKKKISLQKNKPGLAVILVGENKASATYVSLKEKASQKVGINFFKFRFKKTAPEKEITARIKELNADERVNGIIVQLPLPEGFRAQKLINLISPKKDVDGFSFNSQSKLRPVFPGAIIKILLSSRVKLSGKKAVVIANSKIFGETMVNELANQKIEAGYFLSENLKKNLNKTKEADILITACGKPNLIKAEMVKRGVLIVDGGITKKKNKVLGDVDFSNVSEKAVFISPVPGGVGPVTIACLLENVYLASLKK
jgi:methylenetetrahydrofolate dehydrogenase (NADP+)/methenyltetrahydrofolate cyclohydrolase